MRHLQLLQRLVATTLASIFLIGCGALPTTPAPGATATPATGLAAVDNVEIRTLESFPAQAQAMVKGNLPDGCTRIDQITQRREGNKFSVTITTTRPAVAICTQVLAQFEEVIPLDVAGLSNGGYTVLVNGVSTSFELAAGQMVSDPDHDYSMVLPPEWEACTTTEYSRVYCTPQTQPEAPDFPAIYVSIIPSGFTNDEGSVYNFMPEETVRRFLALSVGETLTIGEPNADHSTFTRLPDAAIAGETWAVIENSRVWEGGPYMKDRRWIVTRGDTTYVLGAYYKTQAELDTLEAVLATFTFTP